MSMGGLLDHYAWTAEHAGHIKAQAHQRRAVSETPDLYSERHCRAAAKEADNLEQRYQEIQDRLAELRQQIMDRYERFGGPTNVRVIDERTGDHDRHEISEAAE